MRTKTILSSLFFTFTISTLPPIVSAEPSPAAPSPARQLEVTVIKGEQIPKLLNMEAENFSLMAVVGKGWHKHNLYLPNN